MSQTLSPSERRISELTAGKRTSPRFDWTKDGEDGDGKCWICEKTPRPELKFYCCDKCRKAAKAWNEAYNNVMPALA